MSVSSTASQPSYRQFVIDSIRLYRSLPALWDMKSKEYRNREKKLEAYELMVSKFREVYPDATKDMVKKKFNILRTNYRKELKKVAGTGLKPNLWYFREFTFLNELEDDPILGQEISSRDFKPELLPQVDHFSTAPLNYSTSSASPSGDFEEQPGISNSYETSSSFEEEEKFSRFLPPVPSAPHSSAREELPAKESHPSGGKRLFWDQMGEYQAVGYNVGAKLHKMDAEQIIYAELLINKVLARGLLGSLSKKTDLTSD